MTVAVANPLFESFEASARSSLKSINKSAKSAAGSASLPRFNLKKRSVKDTAAAGSEFQQQLLPTVNSAFLSGLFADVAQASDAVSGSAEPHAEPTAAAGVVVEDNLIRPAKKSRLSLSRSISRCAKSFKNLSEAAAANGTGFCQDSPTGVTDILSPSSLSGGNAPHFPSFSTGGAGASSHQNRSDSLHFQLECVSPPTDGEEGRAGGSSSCPASNVLRAGELAFPHLPATVSSSSCSTLTRNLSDLQSSLSETEEKEAYGWFVATDEDTAPERESVDPYARSGSSAKLSKLAFEAPTAPNADDHDAEVEWAQAADTVDDVLGDFF